jgi:hypothetical protein
MVYFKYFSLDILAAGYTIPNEEPLVSNEKVILNLMK